MALIQIKKPFVHIINNLTDFVFLEEFLLEQPSLEIPFLVEVGHDVAIIFAREYIVAFDDVLVIQLF